MRKIRYENYRLIHQDSRQTIDGRPFVLENGQFVEVEIVVTER
jgi:hypothetical protein